MSDGPLHWAAAQPARPAFATGGQAVTYGELGDQVRRVAASLGSHGIAGKPVAIALERPAELLAAFLGVVEAGGIAVPLAPGWSARERAAAFSACPPALVIGDDPDADGGTPAVSLAELLAAPQGTHGRDSRGSADLFYVGFSSGSTGSPKAIARAHHAWVASFLAMGIEFGVGSETVVAVPGSLFFSFSLIAALQALSTGATLRFPAEPGVDALLDSLDGAHVAYLLPSVLRGVVRRARERGRRLAELQRIVCAGEPLPAALREEARAAFPRAELVEYYGASELGFVTVMPATEAAAKPGSVGRAFFGSKIAVLRDDGTPAAPGEAGLVCARTQYGFAGYYGDPAGTDRIAHHGWHTVGDLGWLDDDGYLYLAGRRDSMVVIRGENVFVEHVERVLLSLPGVHAAAATAEPPGEPTHLVAFVVAPGCEAAALRRVLRGQLSGHALPRRVVLLDDLPRTPTGKIARAALARPADDAR
ncbi:MAG: AMP-binding protein [Dehalococcoidia bacterium]|nr:AMP-binding protein [Dehalococcoidia bacterium]